MAFKGGAENLKNQKVIVVTSKEEIKGVLRSVGDDYLDIDYASNKTALIPFSQVIVLKEQ
jgi:hypothetical protein